MITPDTEELHDPDGSTRSNSQRPDESALTSGAAGASPEARGPAGVSGWVVAGLTAVAGVIPLGVALAVVREPRWYPQMDFAVTEILVRRVGTGDTPLVGLIGRIYAFGQRGSHPGPISFWLIWPVYRLFGATSWALQVGAASLNVLAIGTAIWIGGRRGGRIAALGIAAVVTILALAYGTDTLTQPWNPYIPLLWWVVFLLAAWSVLCDDVALLPVAVFAGSLCLQTHVPYLGLVLGISAVVAAALALGRRRGRAEPGSAPGLARWVALSLALLVVLWLPPLVEQATSHPGNAAVIVEAFANPDSEPAGLGRATVETWLSYLDIPALLRGGIVDPVVARREPVVPGLVLLALWVGAAAWAWRARLGRHVLMLHLVVGVALVSGLMSISRIVGGLASWVVLWAWGTTAVVLVALAWTAAVTAERFLPPSRRGRARAGGGAVLAAVLATAAVAFVFQGARTGVDSLAVSRTLSHVVPDTVAGLESGAFPGTGRRGHYVLRWNRGPLADGPPYGLLLELERQGFDIGTLEQRGPYEIPYTWRVPDDTTVFIHYVTGHDGIVRWKGTPGAVEVAFYDDPDLGPTAVFLSDAGAP
jgi:hypothetical protein